MKDRKKPAILNNIGLKIFALVTAAIMWLLVTTINDPVVTSQFDNIPVKLLNTNIITEAGKVYTVLDNTDVVPVVKVTGARSIVDSIDKDNIVATADVKNLSELETVDIVLSSNKYNGKLESIRGSLEAVRLNIEDRKDTILTLRVSTSGEPGAGYVVRESAADQNQIRVSGPESVVSSIVSAAAIVDVSGASGTITTAADVVLRDAEGTAVDPSNLTMNISSVRVTVTILPTREVPVAASVSGTPASGYAATREITVEPASVVIAGKGSVLSGISSIAIPAEELDISGASDTVSRTVDLSKYLPENTSFAEAGFDGKVTVTAGVEPLSHRTLEFALNEVRAVNVPEGYRLEIVSLDDNLGHTASPLLDSPLQLTVSGLSADLAALSETELDPVFDVSQLDLSGDGTGPAGSYIGGLRFTLPEYTSAVNPVTAVVRIRKNEE